jgi:hypothetical protein
MTTVCLTLFYCDRFNPAPDMDADSPLIEPVREQTFLGANDERGVKRWHV